MKVIDDDDFDHFKKFARKGKFFEMLSWGGLGGAKPPQESPLPVVRRSSSSSVVVIALPCCRKLVPTDFRYRAPSLGLATIHIYVSDKPASCVFAQGCLAAEFSSLPFRAGC